MNKAYGMRIRIYVDIGFSACCLIVETQKNRKNIKIHSDNNGHN